MAKPNASAIIAAAGHMSEIWISLSRRVAKHGGTDENILRLNTPEGEETLGQIAELIANANRKSEPSPRPLLEFTDTVSIPATTGFDVKDRFKVGTWFQDAKVSYVGDNFKSFAFWILCILLIKELDILFITEHVCPALFLLLLTKPLAPPFAHSGVARAP